VLSGHPCACLLQIFRQRHYWAAELGDTLCIGMSTVRFRSNAFSVHEVFIDEEQLAWFEATLQRSAGRPVVVFTHVRCPLPMVSVSCGAHFRFTEDHNRSVDCCAPGARSCDVRLIMHGCAAAGAADGIRLASRPGGGFRSRYWAARRAPPHYARQLTALC